MLFMLSIVGRDSSGSAQARVERPELSSTLAGASPRRASSNLAPLRITGPWMVRQDEQAAAVNWRISTSMFLVSSWCIRKRVSGSSSFRMDGMSSFRQQLSGQGAFRYDPERNAEAACVAFQCLDPDGHRIEVCCAADNAGSAAGPWSGESG
jgi:hypothetical protein